MDNPGMVSALESALRQILPAGCGFAGSWAEVEPPAEVLPTAATNRRREYATGRACAELALKQIGSSEGCGWQADADGLPIVNDFEGDPLEDDDPYDRSSVEFLFDLWKPVALEGNPYQVAVLPLKVPASVIDNKQGARGGRPAR